jgi:hypothetical protein
MKRPEYAAIVTSVYSKAIRQNRTPTAEDMKTLRKKLCELDLDYAALVAPLQSGS